MKSRIAVLFVFLVALVCIPLVAASVDVEARSAVAGSSEQPQEAVEASTGGADFFIGFDTHVLSLLPGSTSTSWELPCNQGAYCRFDRTVCGPEGFCNPLSWCCMCY